jgi:hypothetical protein
MAKPKLNEYDQALQLLKQIDDAAYRAVLIETLSAARVKRELGYEHPSGDLACSCAVRRRQHDPRRR